MRYDIVLKKDELNVSALDLLQNQIGIEQQYRELTEMFYKLDNTFTVVDFLEDALEVMTEHGIDKSIVKLIDGEGELREAGILPSLESLSDIPTKGIAIESIVGDILKKIKNAIIAIYNFIKGLVEKILNFFKNLFNFTDKKSKAIEESRKEIREMQAKLNKKLYDLDGELIKLSKNADNLKKDIEKTEKEAKENDELLDKIKEELEESLEEVKKQVQENKLPIRFNTIVTDKNSIKRVENLVTIIDIFAKFATDYIKYLESIKPNSFDEKDIISKLNSKINDCKKKLSNLSKDLFIIWSSNNTTDKVNSCGLIINKFKREKVKVQEIFLKDIDKSGVIDILDKVSEILVSNSNKLKQDFNIIIRDIKDFKEIIDGTVKEIEKKVKEAESKKDDKTTSELKAEYNFVKLVQFSVSDISKTASSLGYVVGQMYFLCEHNLSPITSFVKNIKKVDKIANRLKELEKKLSEINAKK